MYNDDNCTNYFAIGNFPVSQVTNNLCSKLLFFSSFLFLLLNDVHPLKTCRKNFIKDMRCLEDGSVQELELFNTIPYKRRL